MAPITTASNDENHAELLNALDMHKIEKPFRNPAWKPPQRRNKNLKQILAEAQRAQQNATNTQQNSGATTPALVDETGVNSQKPDELSRVALENASGISTTTAIPTVTHTSIAAAPSLKPKKRYCDITGLPAKYRDPKTGLHYYNAEIYGVVKDLGTAQVQEYLAARGANTILK